MEQEEEKAIVERNLYTLIEYCGEKKEVKKSIEINKCQKWLEVGGVNTSSK